MIKEWVGTKRTANIKFNTNKQLLFINNFNYKL